MQTIFYLDLIFTKFTAITEIILITLHIVNELKKNLTKYNYYNSNFNGVILAENMKTVLKIGINS